MSSDLALFLILAGGVLWHVYLVREVARLRAIVGIILRRTPVEVRINYSVDSTSGSPSPPSHEALEALRRGDGVAVVVGVTQYPCTVSDAQHDHRGSRIIDLHLGEQESE